MEKEKKEAKYLFWAIVILLIFLSYLIVKPYLVAIISAFILAYLARPIYIKTEKKLGKKIAAALSLTIVSLLVIIPLLIVVAGITEQAYSALKEDKLKSVLDEISSSQLIENFGIDLEQLKTEGINLLVVLITGAVKQIPVFLLSIVIT